MQFPAGGKTTSAMTDPTNGFGDKDIAVVSVTTVDASNPATKYRVTLDVDWTGKTFPNIAAGTERPIQVLAKPSDHIVAYFEGTENLVEGVNEAYYSNKIVVQEIGASAKRTAAQNTTSNTGGGANALAFAGTLASG